MRLEFEIEFGLNKRMVVLRITWLELIGMAFVYAELITDGRDIMICPTKRYKFIFYMSLEFMSRIGKPLGVLIFFWVGEGLERRVVVLAIGLYKGGYGEIFRKI